MSLMKTLAKVAVGVALAKGASSMMKGGGAQGGGAGGLGGLLGGLAGGAGGGGAANLLQGLAGGGAGGGGLGALLGGGAQGGALGQGGLGGLLEQLGGAGGGGQAGGLQNMLGGLAGGAGAAGLLGGLTKALGAPSGNSFGEVLNSQFDETPEPALTPDPDQEAMAALMLRAMIQATKADGELDDAEKSKLIEQLGGDVDAEEAQFVQAEMQRPLDVDGLVNDTPKALAPQVYAMSLLGIDLDSQAEAQYLHTLAQGFGLDAATVNDIHNQLGVPTLYN